MEIFGPAGLRSFVRQNFRMTATHTGDHYVVHELLKPHDRVTPCKDFLPSETEDSNSSQRPVCSAGFHDWDIRHPSEECGRDIYAGEDNFWRGITSGQGRHGDIVVDAGSIYHRGTLETHKWRIANSCVTDPCIGFVFRENSDPRRKIVILGDTSDPSTIIPLCINPSPSLLIHEATDAHIPYHIDAKLGRRDAEEVLSKTIDRGHSTPAMAGTFANMIGARRLVLNHIGARFPGPSEDTNHRNWLILSEIQNQASYTWDSGRQAEVAFDYMRVVISGDQNQNIQRYLPGTLSHHPYNQQGDYRSATEQSWFGVEGEYSSSDTYHRLDAYDYRGYREETHQSRKRRR